VVKVFGTQVAGGPARAVHPPSRALDEVRDRAMTDADKRFLRSLRIAAATETAEEV